MAKALDTKKIAALANSIESLKAQIAKEEAELARLCGVAVPAAKGDAPKRRPRKSRTNVAVIAQPAAAPRCPSCAVAVGEPHMEGCSVGIGEAVVKAVQDEIPAFLRRGGTMTDAEKLAAAERAMGGKP